LISKGDEVLVAYPTFLIYEIQAKIVGAKIAKVPLDNLHYPLSAIAKKVSKKQNYFYC